jgi:Flp pilus assembly protein TadD
LAIHVLSTLALFLVLQWMTRQPGLSAFVASLFAVHPLHVESVAWVSARKDVLSGLFWILCIGAYAAYVRRGGAGRYLLALVAFSAGLLAKPVVATLPAVLLLLDLWPLRRFERGARQIRRAIVDKIPFVALATIAMAFAFTAQQSIGAVMNTTTLPVKTRAANAALSVWIYILKTVWPSGLVAYYPYQTSIRVALVTCAVLATLAGCALAAAVWRRAPYITVGWFWYLIALVPVIGIVQVGGHGMADRATYLPLVGLFIVAGWGATALLQRSGLGSRAQAAAATVVVLVCAGVSRVQAGYWHDSISLWQHAVAVQPDNSRAHANLGVALALSGDEHHAAEEYDAALRLNANDPRSHNNLALILARIGRNEEAIAHYQAAVRLDPSYTNARINLANLLDAQGHAKEAIEHYRVVLRAQPDNVLARANLAIAAGQSGDVEQGLREMTEVIDRQPSNAEWHFVAAMMWVQKEDRTKAIGELEKALRLNPGHQRAAQALADLRQK